MRLVTSAEMKDLEAEADARGLTYAEMMRRAGEAVARTVDDELNGSGLVVALVGPGNNGGDALVAAAELHEAGLEVRAYIWKRSMDGDELVGELLLRDVSLVQADDDPRGEALMDWLESANAVIDGLLGTGVSRPIAGRLGKILAALGEAASTPEPPVIVAVDMATGLNPDDGSVDPTTVPADITVTFGLPKVGQYLFPAAAYVGELVHDSIGIPDDDPEGRLFVTTVPEMAAKLPPRPMDGHKGTFGRAMIVGGSTNYVGAPYLAAAAAYRSGCGLVTAAVPGSIQDAVAGLLPEATFLILPEDLGVVAKGGAVLIHQEWGRYQAVLVGPGLTHEASAVEFLEALLATDDSDGTAGTPLGFHLSTSHPPAGPTDNPARSPGAAPAMVVDADALNILATMEGALGRLAPGSVLTPHPGEMGRLLGTSAADVNADRLGTARSAAEEWGHVVVLKGAFTVVAAPDGRAAINPFANAALATAGSGDVLAGLITGFLAQGLAPFEAALVGTFVHGMAGEQGAQDIGPRALMAGDLPQMVPLALAALGD